MPRNLYEKIFSLGLKSLVHSSRTMVFQFDSKSFRRYCCDLGIMNKYSTLTYSQRNGQAKVINKVIVNGLKKRLDDAKRKWVEELSHVL